MVIFSSVNTAVLGCLKDHMLAMVIAPRRPINIISTSRILLAELKSGVIPVESPTVPKADVTSNKT